MEASTLVTGHVDLAREFRGGQRQVYLLTTGLAAAGHPTHVYTRPGTPLAKRLADTPVIVHPLPCLGEWDFGAARRLAQSAVKHRIQLLAAHASHAHGLAVQARRWGYGGRVVVHRRVDAAPGGGFLNRRKYDAPDAFVAISHAVRDVLVNAGIAAEKIRIVSSGVLAHQPVADAKKTLAAETGLDPALPWVGDVAGLVGHKGHAHLLEAWARLVADGLEARLVLVGDGPLLAELRKLTERLGIADSVLFTGWREDVPAWLSALDLFAMTSVTEGLCTAILDAMAARVPVVATAAGGIPELVCDGETGYLAPVGDVGAIARHLEAALTDRATAQALAARAFDEVWRLRSADAMVAGTLAAYREIIA